MASPNTIHCAELGTTPLCARETPEGTLVALQARVLSSAMHTPTPNRRYVTWNDAWAAWLPAVAASTRCKQEKQEVLLWSF